MSDLPTLAAALKDMPEVVAHVDLVGHPSPRLHDVPTALSVAYTAQVAYKYCTARFSVPVEKIHCTVWAEDLVTDHPKIKLIEIKRIIKHMSRMPNFNRIDVNVLHQATQDYLSESRKSINEARRMQRHEYDTSKSIEVPDWFRERTQQVLASMARKGDALSREAFEQRRKEMNAAVLERQQIEEE